MKGTRFFERLAADPAVGRLSPEMLRFFRGYLEKEKAVPFGERFVLNTHLPPWPAPSFDRMLDQFRPGGAAPLFSVTWAVTNRCRYRCWHCYNEGRSPEDLPLEHARRLARDLQRLGAVVVTITGGEPLLRDDLEEILDVFDDGTCLILGTTGDGLTPERAARLKARGLFAVGVSLDSQDADEHDRMRGKRGAFSTALRALSVAGEAGLYPYVVSLGTREFLERERFYSFLSFAADAGAREVHVMEPAAAGKLSDRRDVLLTASERRRLLDYQAEVAAREDLPVLSTLAHIESGSCFGCGAGRNYLYIDGSGEVCPCNLVPMSFGNVLKEPLETILSRMGETFERPRKGCVGKIMAGRYPGGVLPTPPDLSRELCRLHLPTDHDVPDFHRIREAKTVEVDREDLREVYDRVHSDYETHWASKAVRPVKELITRLNGAATRSIFEAGCGTGCGTLRLRERLGSQGALTAVDLSEGMLAEAGARVGEDPRIRFVCGDALLLLKGQKALDLVFSSWVLGYIPLGPFFRAAASALVPGGRLAFVVHTLDTPKLELRLFRELVGEDLSVLRKKIDFDFPRDRDHARSELSLAGLEIEWEDEGEVVFPCRDAAGVLEHLLKSGAGTAYYEAIDPARRSSLERRFLERRERENPPGAGFRVAHDYVSFIARKP